MPRRPLRPCSKLGCFHAVRKQGDCPPECTTPRWQPENRPAPSVRGYGRQWQRIRASLLAEKPLCTHCHEKGITTLATEVDHIAPLARGGTNDRENLQPLCKPCHSRKTVREDGALGRMKR